MHENPPKFFWWGVGSKKKLFTVGFDHVMTQTRGIALFIWGLTLKIMIFTLPDPFTRKFPTKCLNFAMVVPKKSILAVFYQNDSKLHLGVRLGSEKTFYKRNWSYKTPNAQNNIFCVRPCLQTCTFGASQALQKANVCWKPWSCHGSTKKI